MATKYKELENKYKRALADYQNLIKQNDKEKEEFAKYANQALIHDIIPVYDHLKMSLAHSDNNSWVQGVKHVLKQFKQVLASNNVKEVQTVEEHFDPNTMEAVEKIATNEKNKDNIVAKELKSGYTMHERTIIPAQVAVYEYNK
ncbi:MAG: nucleotide exchange factor GrpE [bacterium]